MVIENDPSSRMQVLSMGELMHPAKCMVCGNGTCEAGYVDFQVYYDYEGNQYMCLTCVTQAAETIGMYTPDEVQHLHAAAEKDAVELQELREELDRVRPYVDSLSRIFSVDSASSISITGTSPTSVDEAGTGSDEDSAPVTKGADDGEPVTEEPVKIKRSSATRGPKLRNVAFD